MRFNIITIFPHIFESYFGESIIKRARKKKILDINVINLRDFTTDKHRTVDDTPYGGGAGMILKIQPIYDCVECLKSKVFVLGGSVFSGKSSRSRTILFSAKGKRYTQKDAVRLSKYDNLILICGRYEGVDERAAKYIADEEISIGDYVLSGGEIPAMILVDSISRLISGVLGNPDSLKEESFGNFPHPRPPLPKGEGGSKSREREKDISFEYPQYTKPEVFNNWKVPKVLLSGNHQKIKEWRFDNAKLKNQNDNKKC